MHDSPSRLELLRFAWRVVVQQATASLAQIDGWIAVEERRGAERRRGDEMRPPPPEWVVERGLQKTNMVAVHQGRPLDGKEEHQVRRRHAGRRRL
ncbi:hypothetical protein RCR19_33275 [Streptomyces sp. WAC07094]|uniref:Transposase n=1 Tax=Streptomyces lannensis TaxID=766498 RepID=A0ABP7KY65_9ACTN|nr:hypothetical protein [Streptomyces sp. WAC07094]